MPSDSEPKIMIDFGEISAAGRGRLSGRLLSIATSFMLRARASATNSSTVAKWSICRYLSVTIAPRLLYLRLPIIWTRATLKALAFRTIVPILKSCARFSIAISSGRRLLSKSAIISSFGRPLYLSTRLRVSFSMLKF